MLLRPLSLEFVRDPPSVPLMAEPAERRRITTECTMPNTSERDLRQCLMHHALGTSLCDLCAVSQGRTGMYVCVYVCVWCVCVCVCVRCVCVCVCV